MGWRICCTKLVLEQQNRFFNFHCFTPVCSCMLFFRFYFSLAICFENWQCKKILTFLCLAGRALTLVFVDGESSQIYSLYFERSFFKIIYDHLTIDLK